MYQPARAADTPWVQRAEIVSGGARIGAVEVFYTQERPAADEGPFLKEERKLIDTIAERLADFARDARPVRRAPRPSTRPAKAWSGRVIVEFLRADRPAAARTRVSPDDQPPELERHRARAGAARGVRVDGARSRRRGARRQPAARSRSAVDALPATPRRSSRSPATHMSGREILAMLEKWIRDEKSSFLIEAVDRVGSTLADITAALDRFRQLKLDDLELSRATRIGLRVGLARRLLTDDIDFVNVARTHLGVADLRRPSAPHRRADRQPRQTGRQERGPAPRRRASSRTPASTPTSLDAVRVPRSVVHRLRRPPELRRVQPPRGRPQPQVPRHRSDSPRLPAHRAGLQALALPARDRPGAVGRARRLRGLPAHRAELVSLLEDRVGAAFSGKYKSLFLANQGTKRERLGALHRRGRRGLRVALRPRPDRVPHRARPARLPRGDGR